jgi:hypothetical protein
MLQVAEVAGKVAHVVLEVISLAQRDLFFCHQNSPIRKGSTR